MIDIAIVLIYSITSIIWILKKIHFEGLSFQTNIKVIILKVIISLIFPTSIYIFFSFASMRNENRKIAKIDVEIIDEDTPFLLPTMVNKLLIEKKL